MASGVIQKKPRDWQAVPVYWSHYNVASTGKQTADFTSRIDSACPSGYTFDHIDLIGIWPETSWDYYFIPCVNQERTNWKNVEFICSRVQYYEITCRAWYYKD